MIQGKTNVLVAHGCAGMLSNTCMVGAPAVAVEQATGETGSLGHVAGDLVNSLLRSTMKRKVLLPLGANYGESDSGSAKYAGEEVEALLENSRCRLQRGCSRFRLRTAHRAS
jgi:hypothetical protein